MCDHYVHHCKLRTLCCDKIYDCHRCHNDEWQYADKSHLCDPKNIKIICNSCGTEQDVVKNCISCGTQFGNYFCQKCCLYDDIDKKQFHCDDCKICRIGGSDTFTHCSTCKCCMIVPHKCTSDFLNNNCPICMENLFISQEGANTLNCGHAIHKSCLKSYIKTNYKCPICSKSICDMTDYYELLTHEIENTPMPEEYADMKVKIMCNDCLKESDVKFHIIGMACLHCGSYNSKRI